MANFRSNTLPWLSRNWVTLLAGLLSVHSFVLAVQLTDVDKLNLALVYAALAITNALANAWRKQSDNWRELAMKWKANYYELLEISDERKSMLDKAIDMLDDTLQNRQFLNGLLALSQREDDR